MKEQNYSNHVRYYGPHHFVFYPLSLALLVIAIRAAFLHKEEGAVWWMIAAVIALIILTAFMLRQHYALTNQNRIVRLELRFRYFVLTQKRLEPLEPSLGFGRLAALRFASDEELPDLVERTLRNNLSADEIKKQIRAWLPDHMRV